MKIKKIFLCLFLILISFSVVTTVLAVGSSGNPVIDAEGGSLDTTVIGSGSNIYPYPYFDGIRVSFVQGDGTNLGSQDYILDEQYYANTNIVVQTTPGCSHPAYSNGRCNLTWNGGVSMSSAARPLSDLQSFFDNVSSDSGSYSFPINVASKVGSLSYTSIFDGLYREQNSSLSDTAYSDFIYALFNDMLSSYGAGNVDDYIIDGEANKLYDLFVVFEPVTVMVFDGSVYMGTSYELSYEANTHQGGKFIGSDGLPVCTSSQTALCDLAEALRKIIPCKSYLDGHITDSIQEQQSTILIKHFSNGYYFNNIRIDYENSRNRCSAGVGTYLTSEAVAGHYGVGIGVIWFNDVYDGGSSNLNCTNIRNFYGNSLPTTCSALQNFNFSSFNNQNGTNVTGEWFAANCGCTKDPNSDKFNCTPNYDLGTCTTGDEILYTDSAQGVISDEYWENCVFNDNGSYDIYTHKVSNKNNNLTYFENELGSQYCEVYCIEDLTASFAAPNVNVEAGSKFTWGYSTLEGSRTCKTKSVEWDRFEQELWAADKDIVLKYAEWQLEIEYADAIRNASVSEDQWETSPEGCNDAVECAEDDEGCTPKAETYSCRCGGCEPKTTCDYIGRPSTVRYTASTSSEYGNYSTSPSKSVRWSETYDGHISCPSPSSFVAEKTNISGKKAAYENAIRYAQGLVDAMKKCYTWEEEDVYEVNPQATIIYSDDINYYYRDELDASTSYSFSDDQSVCINDNAYQVRGCIGNSCPSDAIPMKNCGGDDRYVLMVRNSKTNFTLKDDVFRYVLKSNHLSIHPNDLANYNIPNFTTNFIDIGYSNFPVSFSAADGVYGTNEGRGQFDVEYSNLGHVETGRTMVDTILSSGDISNGTDGEFGKWICQYTVYSDLLPEDDPGKGNGGIGDIDLIYRPIDLYNPFPDIDASKRDTGSNWCDQNGDCSYDNNTVQTYIYNNRGVDYDEIYNEEPMYTFVLTPAIIKEIREYNDNNSYASYTGSLGTAQYFDYQCEEGTGIACISDYLSYLIDITGAKDRPGVCVDDQYRSYNDVTSFYNCRY